jgi:hypothetical protein
MVTSVTPVPGTCEACPQLTVCSRRFDEIERRLSEQGSAWEAIWKELSGVRERLAGLEGRIAGYLVAASLLGTAVAFVAAYVFRK